MIKDVSTDSPGQRTRHVLPEGSGVQAPVCWGLRLCVCRGSGVGARLRLRGSWRSERPCRCVRCTTCASGQWSETPAERPPGRMDPLGTGSLVTRGTADSWLHRGRVLAKRPRVRWREGGFSLASHPLKVPTRAHRSRRGDSPAARGSGVSALCTSLGGGTHSPQPEDCPPRQRRYRGRSLGTSPGETGRSATSQGPRNSLEPLFLLVLGTPCPLLPCCPT